VSEPSHGRRTLFAALAVASALLAALLALTVMPGAPMPMGGSDDQDADEAAATEEDMKPMGGETSTGEPSETAEPEPPEPPEPTGEEATMCYINAPMVNYRPEPNTMSMPYGAAREGQAFVLRDYVPGDDGTRWAHGDLRGGRADVYISADYLNC
jgi:hypothetical protein